MAVVVTALTTAVPAVDAQDRPVERGVFVTAGTTISLDSNVLRLPDGITPRVFGVPTDSRSDVYYAPTLRLDATADISRQRITASAQTTHTRFNELTQYNSRTQDYRLAWLWTVGNEFSGEVGAGQNEENTKFEDFRGAQRNVLTVEKQRAALNYAPRPDRRLTVSVDEYTGTNSQRDRNTSDYLIRVATAQLVAVAPAGTEFGLTWRNTDGNYPNRTIFALAPIDNSFAQNDVELLWQRFTGRLKGQLRIGYGKREYPEVPDRNYEGPTYFAALVYDVSGRLSLNFNAARDLNATDDFDNLYAITDWWQVQARFSVTPKVALQATYGERNVDYRGDPNNFFTRFQGGADKREDRSKDVITSVIWVPRDPWRVTTSYIRQQRESNRPTFAFETEILQFDVTYRFKVL